MALAREKRRTYEFSYEELTYGFHATGETSGRVTQVQTSKGLSHHDHRAVIACEAADWIGRIVKHRQQASRGARLQTLLRQRK